MRVRTILLSALMILSAVAVMPVPAAANHDAEVITLHLASPSVTYDAQGDVGFINGQTPSEAPDVPPPEENPTVPLAGADTANWFLATPHLVESPPVGPGAMAIITPFQAPTEFPEDFAHGNWVTPKPYTFNNYEASVDLHLLQPTLITLINGACGAPRDLNVDVWSSEDGSGGAWTKIASASRSTSVFYPGAAGSISIPVVGVTLARGMVSMDLGSLSVDNEYLMLTVSGFNTCGHLPFVLYGGEVFDSALTLTPPEAVPPTATLRADVTEGPVGLDVELTAAAEAGDHPIDSWSLDIDGDGEIDHGSQKGDSLPFVGSITYDEEGVFEPELRVTTADGVTTSSVAITVKDGLQPAAAGPSVPRPDVEETADSDGVDDRYDNCPEDSNPEQRDMDRDGVGDVCDDDLDGDNVLDSLDNCVRVANPDQSDIDGDELGDACDADDDGDGVADLSDLCPADADPDQEDMDGDGYGDACDDDADGDGTPDDVDVCLGLRNLDQSDLDGDGLGDVCDEDIDGDGVLDVDDICPRVADPEQADLDRDGRGDACDEDIDNDGVIDQLLGESGSFEPVQSDDSLTSSDREAPGVGLLAVVALLGAVLVLRRR